MNRDGVISVIAAIGCHGAVLFGISVSPPARPLPPPPEKKMTYVEVTLAASAPAVPEPPAAVAPPPPAPVVKPPPEPEPPPPPKEPEPVIPPPKPEVMKLPEPPPPPPKPVVTPAPAAPPKSVAVASTPAPITTNVGPAFQPGAPEGKNLQPPGDKYQKISQPSYKQRSELKYPERARTMNREGLVILMVYINETGGLDKIEVKQSSGSRLLDDAAVANERNSKFNPMYIGNRPVPSKAEVPYNFKLK